MSDVVKQVGDCECEGCKRACQHRPGFFAFEQLVPLAAQLGLTVKELVREHLQVDFWSGGDLENVFLLVPRLEGHRGASQVPIDPRGTCHWFIDGRCAIHGPNKPAECQGLGHVGTLRVELDPAEVVRTWVGKKEFIENLVGHKVRPLDVNSVDELRLMLSMLPDGETRSTHAAGNEG